MAAFFPCSTNERSNKVIEFETLPQSLKDNVESVDFPFHPVNQAMVVSFKNGLDASVQVGPTTYGGEDGLFELAVGIAGTGSAWVECPLTDDDGITGWLSGEGVVDLLTKVSEFDSDELVVARKEFARQELDLVQTAAQFAILRLAGLGAEDDPFEYINTDDDGRTALGLSADARRALDAVESVHRAAQDKLENDSE